MTLQTSNTEYCCACYESSTYQQRPGDLWQKLLREPSVNCLRCGDYPIHVALTHRPPDEVITAILSAFPEGAKKKDHAGYLPLWLSIDRKLSDVLIITLLEIHPEAAQKQTKNGGLPLHQVIEDGFSCEVIISTLHAFPMAANKQDHAGQYPLNIAIEKRCSDKVILKILNANTDAAMSELTHIGDLPLHQAIKKGYSEEVIISILHAFPKAAEELDHTGSTPLLSSIKQKCPDSIIFALLEANPCATRKLDDDVPLHQAIKMNYSEEVLLAILREYPEACKEKYSNGNLPLNMSIEVNCTDKVIFALLDVYPEATLNETEHGELPLHQVIRKGFPEVVVLRIFNEYPCASMVRCKKSNMLPLHIAAASSTAPRIVEVLIREYPYALEKVANGATPNDLVTSSLHIDSIKMICKPVSYWLKQNSTEGPQNDSVKISSLLTNMEDALSDIRDTLGNVNAKIDAVHYRLHQVESKVNTISSLKLSSFESTSMAANYQITSPSLSENKLPDSDDNLTVGGIKGVFVGECNSTSAITIGREGLTSSKNSRIISELSSGSLSKGQSNICDSFTDEDGNKRRVKALRERLEKKLVSGGAIDNVDSSMSCLLQESFRVTGASKIAFKYLTERTSSGITSAQFKKLGD